MTQESKNEKERIKPKLQVQSNASTPADDVGSVRKSVVFLGFVAVAYVAYLVFSVHWGTFVDSLAGSE